MGFNFAVSKKYARAEVYISRSNANENKFIFDTLYTQKEAIESETGSLVWERLDDKKASRIKLELEHVSLYEREDWDTMISFMLNSMLKLDKSFRKPLQRINTQLKTGNYYAEDTL